MTTDVVFPRGGKKPKLSLDRSERISSNNVDEDDLFKTIKQDRIKKKPKKKKSAKSESSLDEEVVSVENLSAKTLLSDMVVLGCLRDVSDFGLSVSLPGGLTGRVTLTNISDDYTSLLQKYNQNPEAMQDDLATLSSLYLVGSCYPMRVISHVIDSTTSKVATALSMNPKHVNRDITPSTVYHGMLLPASVQSIEDHGYVMSLGLGNMKGFLSISNSPQGAKLCLGQVLLCAVNMPQLSEQTENATRVLTLTTKPKALDKAMNLDETHAGLNSMLPGTIIKGTIMEVKRNGLVVKCFQFSGCIYRDHLQNIFDTPTKYKIGEEVQATILYLHPISNTLHLSLAPKITPKNIKSLFQDIKYGDFIESASVIDVTSSRVYFQISEKVKGLALFHHLSDNDVNMDSASDHFHIGDNHKCRILGFNFLDGVVLVSLRTDVQRQTQIDKRDIVIGKVFSGVVDHTVEHGIVVKFGHRSFGLVPRMHMSDSRHTNPERLLPPGAKVQCRVLRVDHLENYVKPLLTCKPSLVKSSISPLTSYEEAEVGNIYQGVVIQANKDGILLSFYNNIKGWVPVREVSSEYIEYPEKIFYIGQVVKGRVTKCTPEEKRMYLSLRLETQKPFGLKKMDEGSNLTPGKLVSVKITQKSQKGVDVEILPEGIAGFIPMNHLSDHFRLCKLFFELYALGDILTDVLCFNTTGNIIISKKRSLCKYATSGNFSRTISDVQPNQLVPGVIKAFVNYGIFLEIGSGISGLIHRKNILDGPANAPASLGLLTHQTLVARVLGINSETNHIDLSTRLSDVITESTTEDVEFLDNFLLDWKELAHLNIQKENFKDVASKQVGGVVTVTVESVTNEGITCRTDTGISAIVTLQNYGEIQPKAGKNYEAVVLHQDLKNNCLEISLCPKLVEQHKSSKSAKKKCDNLLGKSVACTVLLIRTHFVLASLHKPAEGVLTYLPVFKHPNDLVGIPYIVGETVNVTVQKVYKRFVIGTKSVKVKSTTKRSISAGDEKANRKKAKLDDHISSSDLNGMAESIPNAELEESKFGFNLGDVIEGTITRFSKNRIYVKLKDNVIGSLKRLRTARDLAPRSKMNVRVIKIVNEHIVLTQVKNLVKSPSNVKQLNSAEDPDEENGLKFKVSVNESLKANAEQSKETTRNGKRLRVLPLTYGSKTQIENLPNVEEKESKFAIKIGDVVEGTISNFTKKRVYVKLQDNLMGELYRHPSTNNLLRGTSILVCVEKINNEHIILTTVDKFVDRISTEERSRSAVDAPEKKKSEKFSSNDLKIQCNEKPSKEIIRNRKFSQSSCNETVGCINLSSYQVPIISSTGTRLEKRLQVSGGLKWDVEATPNLSKLDSQHSLGISQQDVSSDSESETEGKKERSGAKNKRYKELQEEEYLNKQELRLMDSSREPETVEDFDRLVLSQPDNSVVWLKYMAYHLQQAEVDKARAVAQRALTTIKFREEQEKLNVWFALLNLENLYGTSESLDTTFKKAVQMNDPFKVYSHMADVYAQEGKHEEAEKLYTTMLKKFKGEPKPWLDFAKMCLKSGKSQKAHELFQKSLTSLDKKDHVEVVTKFAQQEFKHGEVERGKTMFESILNTYPKRTDLWSQYADLLLKKGDVEGTRQVMERSISSNLSAKKMKFLFKKYLDFEKQHGTEELVEKLKHKALEYVNAKPDA